MEDDTNKTKTHSGPSLHFLKALHQITCPSSMNPRDLERQRKAQDFLGRLLAPATDADASFPIGAINAAWVRSNHSHPRKQVILYCHGGGYTSGTLGYSRILASKLANATGCSVLCFEYRLAPEHPHPAAIEDALAAWDYLMYFGYGAQDVIVAGNSAGGNLALVLTQRLKAAGRLLPRQLILLSAWTDMTASGRSYREQRDADPVLSMDYIRASRAAYVKTGRALSTPDISPLFGDFTGFPPTLIQVGSLELLRSDSVRLRDRMQQAGVSCQLEVWRNMFHGFHSLPIKKAAQAVEHIGLFVSNFA